MTELRVKFWMYGIIVIGAAVASGQASAEAELDPITPRLATADATRGAKIFLQCKACHVSEENVTVTVGPNLWGIVNRSVGSQPDFPYTDSLKAIGGQWDYEKLSKYLFDPKAMAPQTRMVFNGVKSAQDRADLIAYLRTLTTEPIALPRSYSEEYGPPYGGLPEGDGREAVYFTCRACHALEQFTDRSLSREDWNNLLTEMVEVNGMASPGS